MRVPSLEGYRVGVHCIWDKDFVLDEDEFNPYKAIRSWTRQGEDPGSIPDEDSDLYDVMCV